jgi:hypothetical protein
VQVDEARRDDEAVGVEDGRRVAGAQPVDRRDAAVLDAEVGALARHAGAVDDGPAPDDGVELGHRERCLPPLLTCRGSTARLPRIFKG